MITVPSELQSRFEKLMKEKAVLVIILLRL
jgi:hypothetical protein